MTQTDPTSSNYTATAEQLAELALAAGFPPASVPVAVAVALAESGGAVNSTSATNDRGLWQINGIHGYDPAQLNANPLYNARAALAISHGGQDWTPWTTYKNGRYRQYLPAAQAAATAASSSTRPASSSAKGPDVNLPGPDLPWWVDPFGLTQKGGPDSTISGAVTNPLGTAADLLGNLPEQLYRIALTLLLAGAGVGLVAAGVLRLAKLDPNRVAKVAGTAAGAAAGSPGAVVGALDS